MPATFRSACPGKEAARGALAAVPLRVGGWALADWASGGCDLPPGGSPAGPGLRRERGGQREAERERDHGCVMFWFWKYPFFWCGCQLSRLCLQRSESHHTPSASAGPAVPHPVLRRRRDGGPSGECESPPIHERPPWAFVPRPPEVRRVSLLKSSVSCRDSVQHLVSKS